MYCTDRNEKSVVNTTELCNIKDRHFCLFSSSKKASLLQSYARACECTGDGECQLGRLCVEQGLRLGQGTSPGLLTNTFAAAVRSTHTYRFFEGGQRRAKLRLAREWKQDGAKKHHTAGSVRTNDCIGHFVSDTRLA